MVEIGAADGLEVGVEAHVAPDGTPQAGSVDGNHRAAVLEQENGKFRFPGLVGTALDVVVLSLELLGTIDFDAFQILQYIAFQVNHEGLFNLLGILFQDGRIAQAAQLFLGAVLGTGEHLGNGIRLFVGFLLGLEALGNEGKECGYYHYDNGSVDNGVYVVIGIHSANPLGG